MDIELKQILARLESANGEMLATQVSMSTHLRTIDDRLGEIINLLTPKQGEKDGPTLDELFRRLIDQSGTQLALLRALGDVVAQTRDDLPFHVVRALADHFGLTPLTDQGLAGRGRTS